jgi:hypothetical protein
MGRQGGFFFPHPPAHKLASKARQINKTFVLGRKAFFEVSGQAKSYNPERYGETKKPEAKPGLRGQ